MPESKEERKINKRYPVSETEWEALEARRASNSAEDLINKPRKNPPKAWYAQEEDLGECPRCFVQIQLGDKVRVTSQGMAHYTHKRQEKEEKYSVCTECFLVKPCECGK